MMFYDLNDLNDPNDLNDLNDLNDPNQYDLSWFPFVGAYLRSFSGHFYFSIVHHTKDNMEWFLCLYISMLHLKNAIFDKSSTIS